MIFRQPNTHKGVLPDLTPFQSDLSRRLKEHVTMLATDIGARGLISAPENLERAASYIEYVFKSVECLLERQSFQVEVLGSNYEVKNELLVFPTLEHTACNVIAEFPAAGKSKEIVVIGAHYDSVFSCPAANDNGSGVAAMLELAKMFAGTKARRTVRFVAFTNEEPPFFQTEKMGSWQYASLCRQRGEKVVAMLSLETIGYYSNEPGSQTFPHPIFKTFCPTTGNFVLFVSNLKSSPLLDRSVRSFRKGVVFPFEGMALPEFVNRVTLSDHKSFWQFGYPALMVTDTAMYRYPHYHTQDDTPDKLDYDNLARVVFGLAQVVRDLAG